MEATFEAMAEFLKRPDMAYFCAYRDDFFVHDRRELVDFGAPGSRYLWAVREAGTHLCRLGVHPRHDAWLAAVLDQFEHETAAANRDAEKPRTRFFLVAGTAITEQTVGTARALLAAPHDYLVSGQTVYGDCARNPRGRNPLATFDLAWEGGWCEPRAALLRFDSLRPLGLAELTALRIIGQCIVQQDAGSLLARIKAVTVDGLERDECVACVGAAQTSCAA